MRVKYRLLNWIRAFIGGWTWNECPTCYKFFGGHEGDKSDHFSSIPGDKITTSKYICPDCTKSGVGCKAWNPHTKHEGCEFLE